MSITAARHIAIASVALVACAVLTGAACGALSDWRRMTSTPEPTPHTPVAFVDHGEMRFATERAALWYRRAMHLWVAFAAAAAVSVVAAVVAANRSDAIGRRWTFGGRTKRDRSSSPRRCGARPGGEPGTPDRA